ncbi:MAG: hypothetical protein ACOCUF_03495 [Patescibacteria group bacterium]
MFTEVSNESAGLLGKTLELSGLVGFSVFPLKSGTGYLFSRKKEDALFYFNSKDRKAVFQSTGFQKECKDALSRVIGKKHSDYYFYYGNHFWEWKASRFLSWKRNESLATVFRLAGLRKKFSVKAGREPGFFSGNIGENSFIGQWIVSSGYFFIAMEEVDKSFLKAIDKIMGVQPLAQYRQCLPVNRGQIFEFFVWDNINPECTANKLKKKESEGNICKLRVPPIFDD